MKLISFVAPASARRPRLGVLIEGGASTHVLDLARASAWAFPDRVIPALPSTMIAFLHAGSRAMALAREIVSQASSHWDGVPENAIFNLEDVHLAAPIPRPGKIICIGLNFYRHLIEAFGPDAKPPEVPRGFLKASSCVVDPGTPVAIPSWTERFDYEMEFAIVIGTACENIPAEQALAHVAGYVILNDMSARDVQRAEMAKGLLTLGKNFPGAAPMGPHILTADEILDPHTLNMELRVNGEVRQRGHTGDLIHKVPDIIAYWSRVGLEPGDVISTGTPSGVAMGKEPDLSWYLKPGDVIEATIDGLGTLTTPIVAGR